ncbi:MAG: murein L,D-transpeptidase [Epsilonproteobacteria bacterium]|nr:murein L,D-transpeptidase [Campylobacterota bacterium]
MLYLKIILLTFFTLFMVSCSTPTKPVTLIKKPQATPPPKPQPLTLLERLEKIDAKVGDPIFIRIFKKEKKLELWVKSNETFKHCKTYKICTYSGKLGPKLKQGDKQSPEGFYSITKNQLKPNSKYHLAFNLGFPNQYDKNQGRTGTYLMIHGGCSSTGCYAMNNRQIEEIYMMAHAALNETQKTFDVHIFPFEMTKQQMKMHQDNPWHPFWVNLKLGHDIFERYGVLPIIKADKDRYRFYLKKDQSKTVVKPAPTTPSNT